MTFIESLPFQLSEELPCDIPSLENPVPVTLVNSRPLTDTPFIAPFVPCPLEVLNKALSFCFDGENKETLMDLGCGDGRILVEALRQYHTRLDGVVGVELDPYLAQHARQNLSQVSDDIISMENKPFWKVHERDMFALDQEVLGRVSCMILYLLPGGLDKLKPVLEGWFQMNPSRNRVITIDYEIPWTKPVKSVPVMQLKSRQMKLHFYGAFHE